MPRVSHLAINAADAAATREFYARVFGWHFEPWGPPGFYRIGADDPDGPGVTAAIQQRRELVPGTPTVGFECTVAVDDLTRTVADVLAAGGEVLQERVTIPGVGDLVWCRDNAGNAFGAMQYDRSPT